jgi:transposase-like protein
MGGVIDLERRVFMPYRYPPEFRRRVLDLLAADRSVASLSEDLGVSGQTIYNWRRQDRIDRGVEPGPTRWRRPSCRPLAAGSESRGTELAVTNRAIELLKAKVVSPKGGMR